MTGKKEREVSSRAGNEVGREERREREGGGMEEKEKRVLFVFQSVPGRLAENSGHVRPSETF